MNLALCLQRLHQGNMKKYTGNIARIATVTGYSALVLSLSICHSALADSQSDPASTIVDPATAKVDLVHDESNSAPNSSITAPATSATPNAGSPATTVTNTKGASCCSTTVDRHKIFVQFIEAVTDKPVPQEIQDLLQGVVSLERKGNDIELTKEDGAKVFVGGDTHFGTTVIGDFSDARDKVAAKFGPEIGTLIDAFVGVTANGSHLEVIRTGPENEEIDLSEHKIKRQLPLKRVRLSKISVDVDVADAHPVLKNITGIEAVPNSGFEIPIVLKEFSRSKNQDGDDVFTFGVKNPFPLMKPFKRLFGIKEIMPLTWTVKKKDTKEIGSKEPAEHKE